jgi:hypothetical protein
MNVTDVQWDTCLKTTNVKRPAHPQRWQMKMESARTPFTNLKILALEEHIMPSKISLTILLVLVVTLESSVHSEL